MPVPLVPQSAPFRLSDEVAASPIQQFELGAALAKELTSRRDARESFGHFVERTIPYPLEDWQWVLCDRLTKLKYQKGQRILIHGFPQSGKSILLSQRFPAWMLGVLPTHRVRLACYNETHSRRFSEVNVNLMRDPDYRRIFPSLDSAFPDDRMPALNEWSTRARDAMRDANPSFKALGLGSGFTGMGVDLGLIDDPYKNRSEAFSDTINENIWFWWTTVLMSRCNPDTNLAVMFHRWRENDLAGRLMSQGGWEVLRFAAIGDGKDDDPMQRPVGIALSPRYPVEYLDKVKQVQGELDFLALYQGNPTNAAGTIFKAAHLLPVDASGHAATDDGVQFWPWPIHEKINDAFLTADTSVSGTSKADMTAIGLTFDASDGYKYLYPLFLQRIDIDRVVREVALAWCDWDAKIGDVLRSFTIESGSAGTPAIISARRLMKRARIKPDEADFALAEEIRKRENPSPRTPHEKESVARVAAYFPPNELWSAEQWAKMRAVRRPLILEPYAPGVLENGERGNIVLRANEVVPWIAEKNLRIIGDKGNWSVAVAWLAQLLALPNGANDDAVQATIGGILKWVRSDTEGQGGATNEAVGVSSDWMQRVTG